MLHDSANKYPFAVANGVDIDLDRHIQEPVEKNRTVIRYVDSCGHILGEILLVMHDFHRAAAQHV